VTLALPVEGRATRRTTATVLWAFIRRDAAIAVSYRVPFVVGVLQSLGSLAFLYFLGRLVGARFTSSETAGPGGYFGFAVVGSALLTVFTATLTSVSQRLRTDQTTGTLEVLFTMPQSPVLSVLGGSAFQVLYALASALATVLLGLLLGLHLHVTGWSALGALAALVGALVLFAATGIAFGAYVMLFKGGDTLTALAASALTVVGGVFFPLPLLPGWLRGVADVVPFTWAVSTLRTALLHGQVQGAHLALLWGFGVVLLPLCIGLFRMALRRARTKGTLGQY